MKHPEFVAEVCERGGYADTDEARKVTFTVLPLLGQRLNPDAAADLAAQLPVGIAEAVVAQGIGVVPTAPRPRAFGDIDVDEFLRRIAMELSTTTDTACWAAHAVLATVREAIPPHALDHVLSRLPPAYTALFAQYELIRLRLPPRAR